MNRRSIEHYLDAKVANEYSIQNHRFAKVLREVFGSTSHLYAAYTAEIGEVERFRADLASALTLAKEDRQKVADRWASFLKTRSVVMEFWSSLSTAFVAIFGLASTLFALLSVATKQPSPIIMLLAFLAGSTFFVAVKFYVDKRVFWFKFVSAHLEAIAKLGANPSIERAVVGRPPTAAQVER
jgi:hypothetical protein